MNSSHWLFFGVIAVIAAGLTTACDGDFVATGPVAVCAEAGRQCQLADGPLGVCEQRPCQTDQRASCFVCTSQH
jgi:hypothetical protein